MGELCDDKLKFKEFQDPAVSASTAVEVVCRWRGRIYGLQSVGGTAENSITVVEDVRWGRIIILECDTELASQRFIKEYLL
jgi:hypothetical protein